MITKEQWEHLKNGGLIKSVSSAHVFLYDLEVKKIIEVGDKSIRPEHQDYTVFLLENDFEILTRGPTQAVYKSTYKSGYYYDLTEKSFQTEEEIREMLRNRGEKYPQNKYEFICMLPELER